MAQSGYTPILIYGSGTASNVPLAANLTSSALGAELALNYADGKLYFKNSSGVVTLLSASGGGPAGGSNTQVQYNSSGVLAGSANLTFNGTTLTANTIGAFTLGGTVAGGGNQINNVIIGTTTPLAGAFTSVTASTTLGVTGTTTLTGVATLTANPVLSAGTANGVTYLNGSKSLTSGTGLVFDGTNLGIGVTPSATWNSDKAIQIGDASNTSFLSSGTTSGAMNLGKNAYSVGSSPKYVGNGYATNYYQSAGTHVWQTAASNSGGAGAALTWSSNMTLDASGNLGIGTTSPGSLLELLGTSNGMIRFTYTGTRTWAIGNSSTNDGALRFYDVSASSERMRIDSSGRTTFTCQTQEQVSINNTSTSTGTSLVLSAGDGTTSSNFAYVQFRNNATSAQNWRAGTTGSSSFTIQNTTASTTPFVIDTSGNVGIGTTSPGTYGALTVRNSGNPTIYVGSSTAASSGAVQADGAGASSYPSLHLAQDQVNIWSMQLRADTNLHLFRQSGTGSIIVDAGNLQVLTGAIMPYAPAPTGIAAATTLTNANIQGQIISATGTTYTITMPLGSTLETLATWATTNIGYDFFVINTATGVITMAVNTNVTSLGSLTIAIGASAHFRIRRTAANTFVLYRLV
jgi:hypothetical protein